MTTPIDTSSTASEAANSAVRMTTREVPITEWPLFFPAFTADYAGWLTTIGVNSDPANKSADAINAIEGRDLPLRDFSFDQKDGEQTIVITAGRERDDLLIHEIQQVKRLSVLQVGDDQSIVLQFSDRDGQTTTVKVSPKTDPATPGA